MPQDAGPVTPIRRHPARDREDGAAERGAPGRGMQAAECGCGGRPGAVDCRRMDAPFTRPCASPFRWPDPPLRVVLVEPDIPPNTGAVARLCAATGSPLHLVGPLGFRLTDARVRRAGLDYWDAVELHRHAGADAFFRAADPARLHLFSTRGARPHTDARYRPGDWLVFGSETRGLPAPLLGRHPDRVLRIPMRADRVRSLNLATAVAIALYEALRQLDRDA